MQRLELGPDPSRQIAGTPDMTITEAAEAMERSHARQILVGRGRTPVGLLSEEDIVARVLAAGLDPSTVRVRDVMERGVVRRDGAFQVDDGGEFDSPLWASERLEAEDGDVLTSFLEGGCEECGVFSEGLHDHEGLLMCEECSGLRNLLFQ